MGFLRSVFISAFVAFLYLALGYALVELIRGMSPVGSWAGLAIATAGPAAFFTWVFLYQPARTSRHPLAITIVSGLGLAITMAMSFRYDTAAGIVHFWAGLAFIGWVLFVRWYSPFKNRNVIALSVGNKLPDFELQDIDNESVSSNSFRGKSHIFLFYRGNWCPYCNAQVREIAQRYREIKDAGAEVILISSQSQSKMRALAVRHNAPMVFLQDVENCAAKKLGILDEWGTPLGLQLLGYASDTTLPTVLITDESGQIIYSHQTDNYRLRPEPQEFLKILATK
jgi:peroxiredoxin